MKNPNTTFCTECEYRTTDGCGPGPIMMCGHPHFADYHGYEAAIIQWMGDVEKKRDAVSYKCPKKIPTKQSGF